jgi:hypothetical protein
VAARLSCQHWQCSRAACGAVSRTTDVCCVTQPPHHHHASITVPLIPGVVGVAWLCRSLCADGSNSRSLGSDKEVDSVTVLEALASNIGLVMCAASGSNLSIVRDRCNSACSEPLLDEHQHNSTNCVPLPTVQCEWCDREMHSIASRPKYDARDGCSHNYEQYWMQFMSLLSVPSSSSTGCDRSTRITVAFLTSLPRILRHLSPGIARAQYDTLVQVLELIRNPDANVRQAMANAIWVCQPEHKHTHGCRI